MQFGSNDKAYPAEMRTQLWPLCCGAKIISGFKTVGNMSVPELVKQIDTLCDEAIPDHQVYGGERMIPKVTFLTLNAGQMDSKSIIAAVTQAGFVQFGKGTARGPGQGFFYRDPSKSFKPTTPDGLAINYTVG